MYLMAVSNDNDKNMILLSYDVLMGLLLVIPRTTKTMSGC